MRVLIFYTVILSHMRVLYRVIDSIVAYTYIYTYIFVFGVSGRGKHDGNVCILFTVLKPRF
jgi:hypothetical protein